MFAEYTYKKYTIDTKLFRVVTLKFSECFTTLDRYYQWLHYKPL